MKKKNNKIKNIAFWVVVVFAISFFLYSFYLKLQDEKELEQGTCWLWILDEEGTGFGVPAMNNNWCNAIETHCNFYETLPCAWMVGSEQKGCRCQLN